MNLNNIELVDRHNRPSVLSRVGLRMFFMNDGVYQDPYEICSVTVFAKEKNVSPSTVLDSDGRIGSTYYSDVLMNFEPPTVGSYPAGTNGGAIDATAYVPAANASGVYWVKTGEYVSVLDGTLNLCGTNLDGLTEIKNGAVTATDYIDIWTVVHTQGSLPKTYVRNFELHDDTFLAVTEPLLIKTSNRLTNKYVQLGSVVDLKVETQIAIENKNIDEGIVNIFKDSVITNAQFEIIKLNDNESLAGHIEVSSYADTAGSVDITSDNTIILNWDTNDLKTMASTLAGEAGALLGPYSVRAKYTVLNETIVTPLMHFIVR